MSTREDETDLDDERREWLRLRFTAEGGRVVVLTAQYETAIDGERVPVTRYAIARGRPHQDILNRRGEVVVKRWLDGRISGEAMTEGAADPRASRRRYRRDFFEE